MTSDRTLNLEALLDTVYRLQVDLVLLADQLARARHPDMSDRAILDLVALAHRLRAHCPSLNRH